MINKESLRSSPSFTKPQAPTSSFSNKKNLNVLKLENTVQPKPSPNSTKARQGPSEKSNLFPQKAKTVRTFPNSHLRTNFNPSHIISSIRDNGIVDGFAATTDQGIFRDYNEDRVSIILNVNKPQDRSKEVWPKCSFFAVYDGHGGSGCCDFLRDNLHQFITRSQYFPFNPKEALLHGFAQAESTFLEYAKSLNPIDTSGSCAIVVLIVSDTCYVANLGDSRAIMSGESSKKVYCLSKDHKPGELSEKNRIEKSGGQVYQSWYNIGQQKIAGPDRVLPGRLSVSRSFGDAEAKLKELGGKPEVLSSIPEIKVYKLHPEFDFIVLGCDGIFDKLSNKEVVQAAFVEINHWALDKTGEECDAHRMCAVGAQGVMKAAVDKRTLDNITVVLIGLNGLIRKVKNFTGSLEKE